MGVAWSGIQKVHVQKVQNNPLLFMQQPAEKSLLQLAVNSIIGTTMPLCSYVYDTFAWLAVSPLDCLYMPCKNSAMVMITEPQGSPFIRALAEAVTSLMK